MSKEKIFFTGGAGFIGSHLVESLVKAGHEVIVCDTLLRGNKIPNEIMKAIEFHEADVRDEQLMLKLSKGSSLIIHFAAVLGVDVVADNPVETMDTEVTGTRNICKAALQNGIERVMYASTSGVYGHSAINHTVTENISVDPRTSYAVAKRFNEIYLAAHNQEKGLNSISLRFFNIYGPRQDTRMVVPRFIEQSLNNEDITIFGSGNQTRDFTYIEDVVHSCMKLMDHIQGAEIYNIAYQKEINILDLAKCIKEITGSASELKFIEAPKKRYDYEVERRWGSSEKLFRTIGYKPETDLMTGLRKII
jgi:UDP-glucose 4-epimerase